MPSGSLLNGLRRLAPGQVLILYYTLAILIGSALLSLPIASSGEPLPFIDALFTATSAQCVTGLTVVDTGSGLSIFGQLVILCLIQLGGLGITTFSVYLFFFLRLGVGAQGRWIINETLLHTPVHSLRELIHSIILISIGIEAAGTAILAFVFVPDLGLGRGLFAAVFHSISAFCNAGFSLFTDSLIGYRGNVTVNLTVMGLITLGGIGFLVIREIMDIVIDRGSSKRSRLSLHSRVVLWTSGLLVLGGALLILIMEINGAFAGLSTVEKMLTAFFQSVTARTAGFNTIDMNTLRVSTLLLMVFLMFVGASPGSAGGGIKTTSLAIFIAIFHSRLKGNPHTNIFRRTISAETVTKTLALVMLAALVVGAALFSLILVQHPGASAGQHEDVFLKYFFETVSAFGTVGLSVGATNLLNPGGKVIIIVLMFLGRVGLLTVAFTIAKRLSPNATRYAEENIMIG
ncbi:TrkH family potassium uptake protein [bacterium]|nr:TrkH family potassium uptake protein [bacterium]